MTRWVSVVPSVPMILNNIYKTVIFNYSPELSFTWIFSLRKSNPFYSTVFPKFNKCVMWLLFFFNSFYTSGLFNLLPQWHFWDIFQSFLPLKIDWDLMFHLGKHCIYLLLGIWTIHFQCCWKAILWKTYSCFPSFIWLECYIILQVCVCGVLCYCV